MKILFATDGSEGAEIALDMLLALPHRATDRVDVVSVPVHQYIGAALEGYGAFVADVMEAEIADSRRVASDTVARIQARNIDARVSLAQGPAPEAILAAAAEAGSDLIVVGSRGRGRIAGAILGSTARALARHSPVPVLVVRERREAPQRILVAVDGSPDSQIAIKTLSALPLPRGSEVTLLYVCPDRRSANLPAGAFGDELRAVVEREERCSALDALQAAATLLPASVHPKLEIERGPVADRVLAFAGAMGADLIVLGSRGATLGGLFIQGSTADLVLSGAHCAVLVARAAARETMKAEWPESDPALAALAVAGRVL